MSDIAVSLIMGVPDIVKSHTTTEPVTRYHPETGQPYQAELKHTHYTLGTHAYDERFKQQYAGYLFGYDRNRTPIALGVRLGFFRFDPMWVGDEVFPLERQVTPNALAEAEALCWKLFLELGLSETPQLFALVNRE